MKSSTIKLTQLIAFVVLAIASVYSCTNSDPLILQGEKVKRASHLKAGIWLKKPPGFHRAKTYDGFQVSNKAASISYQGNYAKLHDVRKSFSKRNLKIKKLKLREMRLTKIGEIDSALYVVVDDNFKKTRRYSLSIQKGSTLHNVKAFCFQEVTSEYHDKIEKALFSTFFDEEESNPDDFQLAKLINFNHQVLTRDGKYPSELTDKATIEVRVLEKMSLSEGANWQDEFLGKEMAKFSDAPISRMRFDYIENGSYLYRTIKEGDIKVFGGLLSSKTDNDILIIGHSNSVEALEDFGNYIRYTFLKTTL